MFDDDLFDHLRIGDFFAMSVGVGHAQSSRFGEFDALAIFVGKIKEHVQQLMKRRTSERFFPTMGIETNSVKVLMYAGKDIWVFPASSFHDVISLAEDDHSEHGCSTHHGSSFNPNFSSRFTGCRYTIP